MYLGLDNFLTTNCNYNQVSKEKKALAFVRKALSENLFRKYIDLTNTKDLWDKLKTDFERVDAQLLFVVIT